MKHTMIDNADKFDTYQEKTAYHMGWMDGMKNSQQIRDASDARYGRNRSKYAR